MCHPHGVVVVLIHFHFTLLTIFPIFHLILLVFTFSFHVTSSSLNHLCTPSNEEQSDTFVDTAPLAIIAPQCCDVRQSGRGLELQNRDLWPRPTDLSWHFPILVTIREMPFKNYRARSPTKLKVREDKIEEAKKQKIPKNSDEEWNSTRWKYSSWTWTTSSSSSAWQEWSPHETRERANWQSADWDCSDKVREATV